MYESSGDLIFLTFPVQFLLDFFYLTFQMDVSLQKLVEQIKEKMNPILNNFKTEAKVKNGI